MKHLIAIILTLGLYAPLSLAATEGTEPKEQGQEQFQQNPHQQSQLPIIQEEEGEPDYFEEESTIEDQPFPWRPRPRPWGFWQCTGRDRGWEEHWGGHTVRGRNYQNVYWRAMNECRRYHGRCYVSCQRG